VPILARTGSANLGLEPADGSCEPMDEPTLAALRQELRQDRAHQIEFLEEHGAALYGEEVRELRVGNDGFADAAQATEERSELLGQIEASRDRLHLIDEALAKMEEGTYGVCSGCGETIAPARLEARPLSVRCVGCATKHE
jgi:DnaK suppressor protein